MDPVRVDPVRCLPVALQGRQVHEVLRLRGNLLSECGPVVRRQGVAEDLHSGAVVEPWKQEYF